MARSRNIKPGFFKNEDLASLGAEPMLLFAGLWTLADRAGRLEDRPKRIKAEIFPYWPKIQVETLLAALHELGFIVRYEVNGESYIEIPNFCKHQNPHVKEAASTIPAPDKHGASTRQAPGEHQTSTGNSGANTGLALPSTDSLLLIPSTADSQASPPPKAITVEFPKSTDFIRRKFPQTDDAMIRTIVDRAVQEVIGAGEAPELVTDEVLMEALLQCTRKTQYSAGFYLNTVPTWFRNKASTEAYE